MEGKAVSFERLLTDKAMIKPDLWTMVIASSIECATICLLVPECSTMNMVPLVDGYNCQLSRKWGACMEKEEAYTNPGCSMYQKKVLCQVRGAVRGAKFECIY